MAPPPAGSGGETTPDSPQTGGTVNPDPALTDEQKIIETLRRSMLEQSEKMVEEAFGIVADGADLKVMFQSTDSNALASVAYYVGSDGKGENLELRIEVDDFLPATWPDGGTAPIYNDRIIAHEMTHAIMARSMNYGSLPKWFKEGTAEFIHGGDERVAGDLYWNGGNEQDIVDAIGNGTDTQWTNDSKHYSSAYVAVRYLHEQIKNAGGNGIKDVMHYLSTNDSATLDEA
nr:flagellinolysin [Metabacillus endolithicus]